MPETPGDTASLENLHDVIVPPPAPFWPPAPGWYVLGVMVLLTIVWLTGRTIVRWWRNRYRSVALAQLAELQELSRNADRRCDAITRAAELIKRVALTAWPRETVAPLSGRPWLDFLNRTGRGTEFSGVSARAVSEVAYCRRIGEQLSSAEVDELFAACREWIAGHDASNSGAPRAQEAE